MVAWIAAAGAPFPCSAQPFDRKTLEGNRQKVIEWARLNGALIDGMTKGEVLKIYGRPDKRFNYNYQSGRLEQWVYYVPRRRSIFPFKASPFAARFRYLYFRDEILVSMQP
ncbi:MAG: hypothetical protein NT045_03905 [Candidatus Aureabacteria bacterium]|nr:hypothetical protein [Candidatus Auribacterota bacterium]